MINPYEGISSMAETVLKLRKEQKVRITVEGRVQMFLKVKETDTYSWFNELAYCLLTAYSSAVMGQLCVDALCDCNAMLYGTVEDVQKVLRKQGHRFGSRRAEYIVEARRLAPFLKETIQGFNDSKKARKWLIENVKGLGWKEASHFLRNVGYLDLAIIDRHILSNMREHGMTKDDGKKGITKKKYLEYEALLAKVAEKVDMPLGEMDLYLWYRKTGQVLK